MLDVSVAMTRSRLRRAFERWLSWYDPEAEARNHEATRRTIAAANRTLDVARAERLRIGYVAYAGRLTRRRS